MPFGFPCIFACQIYHHPLQNPRNRKVKLSTNKILNTVSWMINNQTCFLYDDVWVYKIQLLNRADLPLIVKQNCTQYMQGYFKPCC